MRVGVGVVGVAGHATWPATPTKSWQMKWASKSRQMRVGVADHAHSNPDKWERAWPATPTQNRANESGRGRGRPRPFKSGQMRVGVGGHAHSNPGKWEWAWPATPTQIWANEVGVAGHAHSNPDKWEWAWPATPTQIRANESGYWAWCATSTKPKNSWKIRVFGSRIEWAWSERGLGGSKKKHYYILSIAWVLFTQPSRFLFGETPKQTKIYISTVFLNFLKRRTTQIIGEILKCPPGVSCIGSTNRTPGKSVLIISWLDDTADAKRKIQHYFSSVYERRTTYFNLWKYLEVFSMHIINFHNW